MKSTIATLVAVATLFLPMRGPAQTSTVRWSVSGMGYEVSLSSTTIVKSLVGQRFVGTLQGPGSIIESGFLADTLFTTAVTSIAEKGEVPEEYALEQNYPNPFNPSTTIRYDLPYASNVNLKVYDLLGQETMTLVDEERPAGVYEVRFNAQNLSSGMYIYRLRAGDFVATKRMLVLK
jgi:hypothetical protein